MRSNNAAQIILNSFVQCTAGRMFYPLTLCQPADAQGNPFLTPLPGEMDGASALGMQDTLEDAAQWPLQFTGSTDALCLTSFVFLNITKLPPEIPLSQMLFALVPLSLPQLLAMEEHMAVGANIPSDPRMWSFVNSLTSPTVMEYQQRHLVRLTATKTVHTNGEHEWTYSYNQGKDLNLMDIDLQSYADTMLNNTAITDPTLHAQILALLPGASMGQWNDSTIKLRISDVCFTPSSYTVQVVRETSTYGAISFLSDLGGFANLVSLVMLALFPLAMNVVRPRSFVVLWLSDKWAARTKRKEAEAHAAAQAGLLRGHVGLQAID